MTKLTSVVTAIAFTICVATTVSCGRTNRNMVATPNYAFKTSPSWYEVSPMGLTAVVSPCAATEDSFVPWTESRSITDITVINNSVYFLINKTGIAEFTTYQDSIECHTQFFPWDQRYNTATAVSIDFFKGMPIIRLYRNVFFGSGSDISIPPFLQFNCTDGTIAPTEHFFKSIIPQGYELVELEKVPTGYAAMCKQNTDSEITFVYHLITMDRESLSGDYFPQFSATKISADAYRSITAPQVFSNAPESVVAVLAYLRNVPFVITVSQIVPNGHDSFLQKNGRYCNGIDRPENSGAHPEGFALASETFAAALFSDGTFFYDPGSGKVFSAKLPRPLETMVYKNFVITGTTLFAVWEENIFYKTGKSGLLTIDLHFAQQSN